MSAQAEYDAIVVGAGYAGVTAARDMRDRGLSVLLLEARDRVGGRTYSKRFKGRDELMEYGGAWFSCDHMPNIAREVERYSAPLTQSPDPASYRFKVNGTPSGFPVPADEIVPLERGWIAIANAAARISTHLPLHMQELSDLDVSWEAFLQPLELPTATYEFFLAVISTYVGGHPHQFSALHTLGQIATIGRTPYNAFHGVLSDKFANGTVDILHRMITHSETELRLQTPVVAIRNAADRITVRTEDGDEHSALACVLAVPTNTVRQIGFTPALSEAKLDATARNHPGRGYRVNMVLENAPPKLFALGWGGGLQMLLTEYQLDDGHSLASGFGAEGLQTLDPNDRAEVQAAVDEFGTGARVLEVDAHDLNADPYSDGTWRINPPGEARRFARIMNEPEGRLVFAGSDVALILLNGWMEGAIHSGHRAADRVCAMLGRVSPVGVAVYGGADR